MASSRQEEVAGSEEMVVVYQAKGKRVSDMKVDELKGELESRGLKKSGVKKELQERLCKDIDRERASTKEVSSTVDSQQPSVSDNKQDDSSNMALDNNEAEKVATEEASSEVTQPEQDKMDEDSTQPEPDSSKKENGEMEGGEIVQQEEEKKDEQKEHVPEVPEKKRRISLTRQKHTESPATSSGNRKRRWSSKNKNKSSVVISTDSLKGLIPGVQLASTPALEAVMDFDDDKDDDDDEVSQDKEQAEEMEAVDSTNVEKKQEEKPTTASGGRRRIVHVEEANAAVNGSATETDQSHTAESNEMEVTSSSGKNIQSNDGAEQGSLNRDDGNQSSTESPSETHFTPKRAVSPPRNPPCDVIHVTNLVRPFTQNQLNQLLSKHGTLVDGGFWINKIKSHCYVTYSSVEEAKLARDFLHNQRWPNTSPKILSVDFADNDQMAVDTDGALGKPKVIEEEKEEKKEEVEVEKEKERGKERRKHKEKKEKPAEPSPASLLDKLFRKTTTEPCLYWLPLTKEQIANKDKERDARRKQRQVAVQEAEKQKDDRLKNKERETVKDRDTGRKRRESEKDRDLGRDGKEREADRKDARARETTPRGKDRKPFRENRPSSPTSERRAPYAKRRSHSR